MLLLVHWVCEWVYSIFRLWKSHCRCSVILLQSWEIWLPRICGAIHVLSIFIRSCTHDIVVYRIRQKKWKRQTEQKITMQHNKMKNMYLECLISGAAQCACLRPLESVETLNRMSRYSDIELFRSKFCSGIKSRTQELISIMLNITSRHFDIVPEIIG